ncbi:MAG: hypothetical protein CMO01_24575 [Thalassobius sp.]|nr:hypothetical protein [Thalassovita sp.]
MKTLVSQCSYYQLSVDEQKQRLYLSLKGYWNTQEVFDDFLKDVKKASSFLSEKFSCFTDYTSLKALTQQQYLSYHSEVYNTLIKLGLDKSAQVMPVDYIAYQQLQELIASLNKLAIFGEEDIAEKYLDSFVDQFFNQDNFLN